MRNAINYEEMIGREFGRLVVRGIADSISGKKPHVVCDCICGTIGKLVNGFDLYSGKINSCGCGVQCANRYQIINNEICLIVTDTTLTEKIVNIDTEDIDKMKPYHWIIRSDGYVKATLGRNKYIYLHRLLMNVLDNNSIEVDHINQNPSDNRKYNLRIATHAENNRNIELCSKNTSGFRGVYFDKKCKNWYAHIRIDNKSKHLGSYKNKEDAIKARHDAELLYYGDFSPLNSEKVIAKNKLKAENNT